MSECSPDFPLLFIGPHPNTQARGLFLNQEPSVPRVLGAPVPMEGPVVELLPVLVPGPGVTLPSVPISAL